MKGVFKLVIVAFVSGLAGAFVYQEFLQKNQVTEIIREVPAAVQTGSLNY